MKRLGYLVPEFPGQTHIFFWRELQSLAEMGVQCDLVSTRKPSKKIISHDWSNQAMDKTTYLAPMSGGDLLGAMGEILRNGPAAWWRILSAVARAQVPGLKKRLRLFGLAAAGARLSKLARKGQWNHLHVHSCGDAANVGMFAHLIGGVPYSITLHGPLEDYGPNQRMKWSNAAFGIVITRKLLGEVKASLNGSTPAKIEIAPMGVNIKSFNRKNPYKVWNGSEPFNVFSCGRLNPCKGHDDLIRSIAVLRDRGIDATLKIAGADDSLGKYQPQLEAIIKELNLTDRVQLLGAVSEEIVRAGLESSHAFALGSLHEPLGVAIMEAMAMEMPVVVTRAGGVPELVDDGIDGILVDPRNPADLAGGIEKVARDPELAKRLSAAAVIKIREHFQSDQSARVLANGISE